MKYSLIFLLLSVDNVTYSKIEIVAYTYDDLYQNF